ncbi:hypothetical protein PBT90_00100 [Algoriphagus halophytocola]|uniref:hypothetical protein n=1 Tax=Algoriphagus halophytocola TaxID=2991499 RepID=UPI0022DD8C40|nr:hypothetical protein [Algoriphagus sp. TR-M9]WBL42354.1 hypothetical protein PBT90_16585 [Algoriphagus sp. TR-M9]WBL43109.1 hypothetical protein PBT90_00100 [Algoriphagus sp. TR-M9]
MERVPDILIRFAKSRLSQLRHANCCTMAEEKAAEHIITVAGYFSTVPKPKQINCIRQLMDDILLLIPSESSRFQKLRQKILDLIHQYQSKNALLEKPPGP